MPFTLYGFLADVFARFIQESSVPLVLHSANSQEVYEMLIDQTIDMGITSAIYPSPQIKYKEIYRDRLVCVASPMLAEHCKGEGRKSKPFLFVWMHKFKTHPWHELFNTLTEHPQFDIKAEMNNFETARELAVRGVGFTTLPYSEVKNQLASGELVEVNIPNLNLPHRSAYIATYRLINETEDMQRFLHLLYKMAPPSYETLQDAAGHNTGLQKNL
jgi:DNA-binding transcriptional LysR family regulator